MIYFPSLPIILVVVNVTVCLIIAEGAAESRNITKTVERHINEPQNGLKYANLKPPRRRSRSRYSIWLDESKSSEVLYLYGKKRRTWVIRHRDGGEHTFHYDCSTVINYKAKFLIKTSTKLIEIPFRQKKKGTVKSVTEVVLKALARKWGWYRELECFISMDKSDGNDDTGEDGTDDEDDNNGNECISTDDCGRVTTQRIVGGVKVDPANKYPWVVSLQYNNRPFCGGALVSSTTVVTAAHCLDLGLEELLLKVVVSEHNLNIKDDGQKSHDVEYVKMHEDYNYTTYDHDIGIIKLTECVTRNETTGTICLPDNGSDVEEGQTLTVAGWGRTSYEGVSATILREVNVTVVDRDICSSIYQRYYVDVTENMICAGDEGKDACQGDSGGPAMRVSRDLANFQLAGVVSWGYGCAFEDYPGVYARVGNYIDWIMENIE